MGVDPEFISENVLENYEVIGKIARGCFGIRFWPFKVITDLRLGFVLTCYHYVVTEFGIPKLTKIPI